MESCPQCGYDPRDKYYIEGRIPKHKNPEARKFTRTGTLEFFALSEAKKRADWLAQQFPEHEYRVCKQEKHQ